MRLVLDPAEEAAHGDWLRQMPGAYEWWYFDALSDDGDWALTCIWFLGNPFSPYYRDSTRGRSASPYEHNAFFFALYRQGRLHAYHFTRFPQSLLETRLETRAGPLCLRFGPNRLTLPADGQWLLELSDENANGRRLLASLTFSGPTLTAAAAEMTTLDSDHSWLPIAPYCRVQGRIDLQEPHNLGGEILLFNGTGYHDHNWGRLPFDADIRDWYWARATLSGQRSVILYHIQPHHRPAVSHLLLFDAGRLLRYDAQATVSLTRPVWNGFLTRYFSRLFVTSGDLKVDFRFNARLDSAPFYVRALCRADVRLGGSVGLDSSVESGKGIGEYLRPRLMSWPLVASAMKARIVQR